jgi:hypothetical protein
MKPFSEDARPEQGNGSDPFYATGSIGSIGEDPGSFSTSLSNKEQIRLSFAVKNKVQMLPNSSSIYYFNTTAGQWNIPSKALSDHVGPFGNVSVRTALTNGSVYIEDAIGFDHRGSAVVSGSLPIQRNLTVGAAQKIEDSQAYNASSISRDSQSDYMSRDFPKSVQRNPDYGASSSETFTLPISDPFLIEKVVFEIPFCFGNGWFYDKTSLNFATSSAGDYTLNGVDTEDGIYFLDQGGPGITLSLSSQKNYGTSSIRDLICHGLITHEEDLNREVKLTKLFGDTFYLAVINGIDTSDVECVVTSSTSASNKFFTGSIQVKSTAEISNGISTMTLDTSSGNSSQLTQWITDKLSSEYSKAFSVILVGIDTFGRGMTGFAPSGGSIFGGEYTTDQVVLRKDGSIKNELYISDSTKRTAAISSLSSLLITPPSSIVSLTNTYFKSSKVSPYLIYPGEKLILAASKTRPALKTVKVDINTSTNPDAETKGIGTLLSSSYINSIPCTPSLNGHDVQFNTGSINITFYGSYVRGGNSYIP